MQRLCKQVLAATDTQVTVKELLGIAFYIRSVQNGYKEVVYWRSSARIGAWEQKKKIETTGGGGHAVA
jgi:hypothetical protein